MDHALPLPGSSGLPRVDRRHFIALVLAGTAGVALDGVPMSRLSADGPALTLASVQRTVSSLAATFDTTAPSKVARVLKGAEHSLMPVLTDNLPASMTRDARVAYSQVLAMSATVSSALGEHADAARTADMAASLAVEAGDAQAAGLAWAVAAGALAKQDGRTRASLDIARRARAAAGSTPAAVVALLEEASTASRSGQAHITLDAVVAAEETHRRLGDDVWGTPGYPLATYHPVSVLMYGGFALTRAGLHDEAAPRLAEAGDLLAGRTSVGLRTFVWLGQAQAALGAGDVDNAHAYAALAVELAQTRPTAGVVATIHKLNRDRPGAFTDLVEQVDRWGFSVG
ncbi:hypothetical protein [Parafrankia sp. BMG5.11]|uniref:hypothetical protein n=1 Tax=Parafrankia sp. BMG5.11 TaxID=222540 RepID=UPI00103974D8|nr:hypothetical protein [Parafrankia sp. BMG5.11]TCJ36861.1 hypothetical protein E0504_21530 [Parafrankia sp. BMG5.11]